MEFHSAAPFVLGFVLALIIGLTGVGGGTLTTPLLILVLRMPPVIAVGTALTFSSIVKLVATPVYIWRKQVVFKALGWMLLGGVPGVVLGGLLLSRFGKSLDPHLLYLILGLTVVIAAGLNIYRLIGLPNKPGKTNRPFWQLAPLMAPIAAEIGFTSAGSAALVSLVLLGLTTFEAAQVVGTGLSFGLVVSIIGSGIQIFSGNVDQTVLVKMLIGGVAGALSGAMLAIRIPSRPLKWGLAVFLAGLGVQLFWRSFS